MNILPSLSVKLDLCIRIGISLRRIPNMAVGKVLLGDDRMADGGSSTNDGRCFLELDTEGVKGWEAGCAWCLGFGGALCSALLQIVEQMLPQICQTSWVLNMVASQMVGDGGRGVAVAADGR